jgi:ribonuclease J
VYRGTKEIGGTCIEVKSQNGKILWIDLGQPLETVSTGINYTKEHVDALLISHPHQDHYGLMGSIKKDIPIYIGEIGLDYINAVPKFVEEVSVYELNFNIIKPWKAITILDTFIVTPYLTDHSTPESFSFLIEVDDKRIYYSGDFRATGRKRSLFDSIVSNPPKAIDVLFMEGTMINRSNYKYNDEESIESALTNILSQQQSTSFLISSAQNIDRLVSCYRACKRTGKVLVIDAYTAWLLEKLKRVSTNIPTIDRKEIQVYCSKGQLDKLENDTAFLEKVKSNFLGDEIFNTPSKYLYFTRCPSSRLVDRLKENGVVNILYSQWKGYLQEEYKQWFTPYLNAFAEMSEIPSNDIRFEYIHTSGHAKIEDLVIYAKAMNANKLVPIHTAYPKEFKMEMEKEGVKNVELWYDNITYRID